MVIRCIHETHASVQKPKPLAKQDCTTRMKVATNVTKTVSTIIEGMVGVSQPTLQSPQFTHVHLYSVQICELQLCILSTTMPAVRARRVHFINLQTMDSHQCIAFA